MGGLPFRTYIPKPRKFRGRYGVIYFSGTHQADDNWRLNFWLGVCQYNSKGQCKCLWVVPTDEMFRRLQKVGMVAQRCSNPKQIIAEVADLRHGPVGLALLLESRLTADDHHTLYIQPSMRAWGEYRNRSDIVKKALWIKQ